MSRAERVESAPPVVPDQARAVAARLGELLGDDIVGVYLHGSFALGCGNPNRSDLDLLAVTRRGVTPAERAAFATLPAGSYDSPGWPRPLELSSLTTAQLHPWRHPTPYDVHVTSRGVVGPGDDADLAAHVTVTRRAGIALVGAPPADVFPEVPRADYEDSLLRDFGDALAVDDVRELRYAILTLPRIWATLANRDLVPTKESGAVWALERLPQDLRRPLELALESYRTHGREIPVSLAEFRPYADHIAREVRR